GIIRGCSPDGGISGDASGANAAVLPVVVIVMGHKAERFTAIPAGSVGLIDRHRGAIQHAVPEHLVRMVVKRGKETDTNLAEIFQIRIGDIARGTVVFDQVLIVLVIRFREFRKRAQILRCTRVRLQGTRSGPPRRVLSAGAWGGGSLPPSRACQHSRRDRNESEAHSATPSAIPAGTWQWLQFRPVDLDGIGSPECLWKPAAGPVSALCRTASALR